MNMNKPIVAVFIVSMYVYFSLSSTADLYAQQRGTISAIQATALPLVNSEGNQVKVLVNYSIGDESIVGQKINAVMGIYDRINGTLIKLSSFPDGLVLNNTEGTIQLASTLTNPMIQNISTIVTLTNVNKSEKYSNDIRSDLDLSAILPTSLPASTLDETLASPTSPPPPLPPPPSPQLPPVSTENNGEDDDASSSNSDDE
jgi:hypothetical protein